MTANFDPRRTAARLLRDLESRTAFAEPLLDSALAKAQGDPRDKAFLTTLVYGVLRQRYRLDRFIEEAASRPVEKIHPMALAHLRAGAFQLLFMDRVPARAAVDRAVEEVKAAGLGHIAGFVNAVLRRISEGMAPQTPSDPAFAIALAHSVEPMLAGHWLDQFGEEGAAQLAALSSREPPLFLRLDPKKGTTAELLARLGEGFECGPGHFAPDSAWVTGGGDPRAIPLVADGSAMVQGQASQLVAPMLEAKPGMRILDACAAPGMKSLHLASLMDGMGLIVALDIHAHKVKKLGETAKRLRYGNIRAMEADASVFADELGFDGALVDAPCTGLGVLARNPERKWRLEEGDPARLSATQLSILKNVGGLVKSGGLLVYATCTTSREENEGVVEAFLAECPDYVEDPAPLPEGLADAAGRLKTYPRPPATEPGAHLDGFFAARFRRR